jgi:predicted aspartyl protease
MQLPQVGTEVDLFLLASGHPAAMVKINGQGPFLFIIDTGTELSFLSEELIEHLALQPIAQEVRKINNLEQALNVYNLAKLVLEDSALLDLKAIGIANNTFFQDYTRKRQIKIYGVLGFGAFYHCTMGLDFQNAKLKLSHARLNRKDNLYIMPLQFKRHVPIIELNFMHNTTEKKFNFILDTGYNGELKFALALEHIPFDFEPLDTISQNKIQHLLGEQTLLLAKLHATTKLGHYTIFNPLAALPIAGDKASIEIPYGLLGMSILKEFVITFDQRHKLVEIKQAD